MASFTSTSTDLKIQAKRLKAFLNSKGISVSHSQALEAIASIHGFKDWNVASNKSQSSPKTYVLCCYFETSEKDSHDHGYFQFVMKRESLSGIVEDFKEQITEILKNDINESKIKKLYLDNIIEIESTEHAGVPINMILPGDRGGVIGCVLPFVKQQKGVASYTYREDDQPEDENDSTVEPILTFNI